MTMLDIINGCFSTGDSYIPVSELYDRWENASGYLPEAFFQNELRLLQENGSIIIENQNVYLTGVWQQEEFVAEQLSARLLAPPIPAVQLPDIVTAGGITLEEGQKKAVEMALNNRLSLILGGAGTGKTTLIQAIIGYTDSHVVLCSPTAKAAINLSLRTGITAATIHRTLGVPRDGSFAETTPLNGTDAIIIDEAGMLTLEMLAGLLKAAPQDCRIVLVGDDNQLPPVGVGHVLRDLAALPVPCVRLKRNHRQIQTAGALHQNITRFEAIHSLSDLAFDESFSLYSGPDCIADLAQTAAKLYQNGTSVQVIAPRNDDVNLLNRRIQSLLNPMPKNKLFAVHGKTVFVDGDRVVISRNDPVRGCFNGENGVLSITESGITVALNNGRKAYWVKAEIDNGLNEIALGYAITTHKSQGSEYDIVLLYVTPCNRYLLTRRLMYTAISRARKRLILYGDPATIDRVLSTDPVPRRTFLVSKTRAKLCEFESS